MSPTLAIDFGSSRTKIAYFCTDEGKPKMIELGQEIRAVMPSVFYIPPSGNVLVGDQAAQMADEDPSGIVVDIKRDINRDGTVRCGKGRRAYQRWELVSALFSEIRNRCNQEVFHNGTIDSCTLTVPVCFSELEQKKLRQAAQLAGFKSVKFHSEPVAAAMHWLVGSGRKLSDHVIVVDIGGGTTDLAALKLCGSNYEPIPGLQDGGFASGGNDIDEEIRKSMEDDPGYNAAQAGALLMKLRVVKERLLLERNDFSINLAGNRQTITRDVVEDAVRSLVKKTCAETERFLKDFKELTGRADTPVLLAGGGSKLPGMKEALEIVAGSGRVFLWNDSEYAIVLGAALIDKPPRPATSGSVSTLPAQPLSSPADARLAPGHGEKAAENTVRNTLLTNPQPERIQKQVPRPIPALVDSHIGTYEGTCNNTTVKEVANIVLIIRKIKANEVFGDLTVHGDLTGGAEFQGAIRGNEISFVIRSNGGKVCSTFTGTISLNTISGSYRVVDERFIMGMMGLRNQQGLWECKKTDS